MRIPFQFPDWSKTESHIKINGQHLPLGSARNLDQSYSVDYGGDLEPSLDGGLVFMGIPDLGFRITTTISGDGLVMPHLYSYAPWDEPLVMDCALHMYMPGQVRPDNLLRPHSPGSIRYFFNRASGDQNFLTAAGGEEMADDDNVSWTSWRPRLLVRPLTLTGSSSGNEQTKLKSWSWDFLEEKDLRLV